MIKIARLGDLLDIQNGFAFPSDKFVSREEGVPLIRIRDLGKTHTEVGYRGKYRDEFMVNPGDLLIGMDGSFECHRWEGPPALLNQRLCRLRNFSTALDRRFLFHWIGKALKEIHSKTSFVTVKHISSKQIANLNIPLPPLDEQRRIVGLLDRAAEIRRRADAARAKARAIIPALFLDMFGDPATNPRGWPIRPFGEGVRSIDFGISAALSDGTDPLPGTIPVIRMPNISPTGDLITNDLRFLKVSSKKRIALRLEPNDVIFNWRNSPKWIGKTTIWDGRMEAIFASFLYRIRLKCDQISPIYVKTLFNILRAGGFFESRVRQAVSQANFGRDELCAINIGYPEIEIQHRFADTVQRIEATARALDAAAAKAEAMAAGLSAEVFGSA